MNSQPVGTIDVGAVFERVIQTYSQHWRVLMLGALVIFAPIALLGAIVAASGSGGLAFIAFALIILGSIWYQGMVVETVQDVQDGKLDSSLGQLFSSVTPVLGTLLGAGILAVFGIGFGLILLIVPGLYLLTIWAVLAPVIVIERAGVGAAFGRSRELVRGNGWQVFGVIVAVFAAQLVLSLVIGAIGAIGDSVAWRALLQLVQSLILAPVWALAAAIVYFALREARGDSPLAQPTGVLSGGFVPPVPPAAPVAAGGPEQPLTPAAPEQPVAAPPPEPAAPQSDPHLGPADLAPSAPAAQPPPPPPPAPAADEAQPAPAQPPEPEPGQSVPPPGWRPPGT